LNEFLLEEEKKKKINEMLEQEEVNGLVNSVEAQGMNVEN
jgi:hypothetical protein